MTDYQRESESTAFTPLRIEASPGTRIDEAVDEVVRVANAERSHVVCEFNGTDLEAEPGITSSTIQWLWAKKMSQKQREAKVRREATYRNNLKIAVCDYLIGVNDSHDNGDGHKFIAPTAIDWLGNGLVDAVLGVKP